MTTRRGVLVALLALTLGHWAWRSQVPVPERADQLSGMRLWSGSVLVAAVALAIAARTRWLLVRSERAVLALPLAPVPPRLAAAVVACGPVPYEVACVSSGEPTAFAVGNRGRIYVTTGLVRQLDVQALAAVLAHEVEHARRRDPARRAFWRACSELLWPLPIARWWVWLTSLRSELAADRVAVVRCGEAALARALVASAAPGPATGTRGVPSLVPTAGASFGPIGSPEGPDADPAQGRLGVAFHTSAFRRAARLLGEELPPVRPRWPVLLGTLGWLALMVSGFGCLTELAAAYLVF